MKKYYFEGLRVPVYGYKRKKETEEERPKWRVVRKVVLLSNEEVGTRRLLMRTCTHTSTSMYSKVLDAFVKYKGQL